MKKLLLLAILTLTTACASSAPVRVATTQISSPNAAGQTQETASEPTGTEDELATWQQLSVEAVEHLEHAQPGEMGMSLTSTTAAPAEEPAPRRSLARPKLVSKRNRSRLFVLPTRNEP